MSRGTGGLTSSFVCLSFRRVNAGAVNKTDITATEHVAVTLSQAIVCSNLTTMNVYLGLSEYVTVHVERTLLTIAKGVVALTTTKDITEHMTVEHLDVGLTGLIDTSQRTNGVRRTASINGTATNGGNLTAADEAVAYQSVPHRNMTEVDTTLHVVATAKQVTAVSQAILTFPHIIHIIRVIMDLFLVAFLSRFRSGHNLPLLVLHLISVQMDIADVSIVDSQVGRTVNSTAFTAAVGITLDGRQTSIEAIVTLGGIVFARYLFQLCDKIIICLVRTDSDNHVGLAGLFVGGVEGRGFAIGTDGHRRIADITLPATTIDITYRTACNESVGTGRKILGSKDIVNCSRSSCRIDILVYDAAKEGNIGGAVDITTADK